MWLADLDWKDPNLEMPANIGDKCVIVFGSTGKPATATYNGSSIFDVYDELVDKSEIKTWAYDIPVHSET